MPIVLRERFHLAALETKLRIPERLGAKHRQKDRQCQPRVISRRAGTERAAKGPIAATLCSLYQPAW
jgi:hypothetical protein